MRRVNSDPDGREPDWDGLEQLAHATLKAFKSSPRADVGALIAQIDAASVASVDFTGHGFYADLVVPNSLPPLTEPTLFGALLATAVGGEELIGLNLFLDDGRRIICLEGFNCGDVPFTAGQQYVVHLSEPLQDQQ